MICKICGQQGLSTNANLVDKQVFVLTFPIVSGGQWLVTGVLKELLCWRCWKWLGGEPLEEKA